MTYVGAETLVIDDWMRLAIGTSSTPVLALSSVGVTGVYDRLAPANAIYPFVVWQSQSIRDVGGVGPGRWMLEAIYIIKAIAEVNSFEPLKPIVQAIDTIVEGVTEFPFAGGYVNGTQRIEPFQLVEFDDGHEVRHFGGQYRIYAQAV